ncbi:PREDICTED: hydroxyproline O-arabinosyltransferase 3-like [Lupinus angustifolius]|uniref:hydroxyproline O-arabinosyltransferase 3-like n=1 Tax=Lupinus angustifolius TaxID=3871 RepID=UPI00092EBC4C|nr:PREDICTED: hydroxyproline O-arabinosyltransferase 3-like [Lupinus angustifolius]XP_019459110.1 PREDICTED: hydroxyproline O-arabinosyltransferase 3-like [Lupinus angustifolius]
MIVRKNMGRAKSLLMLLIVLGFSFATYNLVSLIIEHNKNEGLVADESFGGRKVMGSAKSGSKYHVALTATDAAYSQWQCRIMYYWYKKVRDMPGSDMGKFTRILHSGRADQLMNEIPTFVADPLPEGLDRGYIVLNRPWAFVQWLEKADIEEEYILMAEPDHIFVNPLPNLASRTQPAGFPFFYIKPAENEKIIRKFYPEEKGPVTDVDPIGNSPVIIQKSLMEEIAPSWVNISLRMKDDPETDKAFGWVLEMYAYAVASALHGVKHILRKDFMLQPPWDLHVGKKFIIHYTYGCDYNLKGELTYGKIGEWRFDKRSHLTSPPPKNLSLPPPGVPESVVRLVKMVNEATANIPEWDSLNRT